MLWEIIKKEVHDQLLSLRLLLAFLLVVLLMIANAFLFQTDYEHQLKDYSRDVSLNLAALAKNAAASYPLFNAFSYGEQFIYRRPNPLNFIAEGHDKDLPNASRVNAFRLEEPQFSLRGNPLLWRFDSLDWAFIVTVILSFTAVVLVYDGINGEKQRGTLRLIMSQPVPRATLLLGKYFSAVLVLVLPLAAGALANLLIIGMGGSLHLDAALLGRIGISCALCLLYVSLFALLGLFLSARSKTPVVSLVTGLIIWVFVVIVVPAAGNLVARGLVDIEAPDRVVEAAQIAKQETAENYNRRHPHPDNWIMSGRWSPGEPLQRAFEADEARNRVFQSYQQSKMSQVRLGRKIAAFSPAALLTQMLEHTVESGYVHYESYTRAAHRYQQQLASYLDSKYPLDKMRPVNRGATDRIVADMKLDFDAIPKFEDRTAPIAAGVVLQGTAVLALINIGLFAAAFLSFLRYDVR